ncbi:MAG TPA: hypothetical protein GXZ76_07075 [Clostridiaceae bacterium]|nr:hypothetical protein [Clostridiaceae bacterium]
MNNNNNNNNNNTQKQKTGKTSILKSLSVTIFANGFGFIVSALTTFLLPIILNDGDYGYWHLYLLYSGYTLYFSLGLTDGIYLRYGGYDMENINKRLISGQFWLLVISNIIINLAMIIYCFLTFSDRASWLMVVFAAIAGLITVPRSLITLLMQATNHFEDNARVIILERVIFVIGIVVLFIARDAKVYHFVLVDIAGKLLATLYTYFKYPYLIFSKLLTFKKNLREFISHIKIGIHIVLASLSSILTLNILRHAIVAKWGVESFGNVSLSISISNMFVVFINAVAIVLFPTLRRVKQEDLRKLYKQMETIFISLMGLILFFFYPFRLVLLWILPNKAAGISYLSLLFPLFLYEGKNSLLLSTYFKVLRKEKILLFVNAITILISYILTFFITSINLAVLSILIVQIFRAILGEILLSRIIDYRPFKRIFLELFLTITFLICNNYIGDWKGMLAYGVCYIVYFMIDRRQIKKSFTLFKTAKGVN